MTAKQLAAFWDSTDYEVLETICLDAGYAKHYLKASDLTVRQWDSLRRGTQARLRPYIEAYIARPPGVGKARV